MFAAIKHLAILSGLIFNGGNCLRAFSKVPIEIYKFLIEVPFAKEKSPCKYEVSGLYYDAMEAYDNKESVLHTIGIGNMPINVPILYEEMYTNLSAYFVLWL